MNPVYLDTSAFLKLFLDEPESRQVSQIIQNAATLFASRLVLTEARISLARYERVGRIKTPHYEAAMEAVADFWNREIEELELNTAVLKEAERQGALNTLGTLDAIHLATAKLARKTLPRGAVMGFLTFDQQLLAAALSIRFLNPLA